MDSTYLMHYGVKGMKWGIRRTAAQLGHKVNNGVRALRSNMHMVVKTYNQNRANAKRVRVQKQKLKVQKASAKLNAKLAEQRRKTETAQIKAEVARNKELQRQLKKETFRNSHPILTKVMDKRAEKAMQRNETIEAAKQGIRNGIRNGIQNAVQQQIVNAVDAGVKTHYKKILRSPEADRGKKIFATYMTKEKNQNNKNDGDND